MIDPDFKEQINEEESIEFKEAILSNASKEQPVLFLGNILKPNPYVYDKKIINSYSIPRPFMKCLPKKKNEVKEERARSQQRMIRT